MPHVPSHLQYATALSIGHSEGALGKHLLKCGYTFQQINSDWAQQLQGHSFNTDKGKTGDLQFFVTGKQIHKPMWSVFYHWVERFVTLSSLYLQTIHLLY